MVVGRSRSPKDIWHVWIHSLNRRAALTYLYSCREGARSLESKPRTVTNTANSREAATHIAWLGWDNKRLERKRVPLQKPPADLVVKVSVFTPSVLSLEKAVQRLETERLLGLQALDPPPAHPNSMLVLNEPNDVCGGERGTLRLSENMEPLEKKCRSSEVRDAPLAHSTRG